MRGYALLAEMRKVFEPISNGEESYRVVIGQ